ncbi:MAG: hypothetical protein AAGB31_12545 [Bdellovibrio sp.]
MPHRFIFSLRFSSKVFMKLGLLSLTLVLFMTFFRMNLYFLSVFHATPDVDVTEVFHSFLAGVRFDLLILGFVMIPVSLILLLQAFTERWPSWMFVIYRGYFMLVWFLICVLTFIDFFHFVRTGMRMRFTDYMMWTPDAWMDSLHGLQRNQIWIFSVITILLFNLGYMLIKGLRFGEWKDEFSPNTGSRLEMGLRIVIPLMLVALAARGTVTAHHLAWEHSDVSGNKAVNEMALNAVWCFDK